MVYSIRFGVLLLIATAFGEIYFEEDFEDDSWRERWVSPPTYGIFERSTVAFYGGGKSTGLKTKEDNKDYLLSTRFNPITIEKKPLVVQFTVKFSQITSCNNGRINLYGCNFTEIEWDTDTTPVLQFGPVACLGKLFGVTTKKLWGQIIFSSMKLPLDKRTHVYTLILRPNRSCEFFFDDGSVFRKNANLVVGRLMRFREQNGSRDIDTVFPSICAIGFNLYQDSGETIFDNILLSDDVTLAKRKRDDILSEMTRWKSGRTGILVDIAAADLTKILDCKGNIEFGRGNLTYLIFEDFDKFLVPLDWSNRNSAIMATAEYNRLRGGASNDSIQLWVSFQPRNEDILDDIDWVLEVVNEANSIAPKTVTAIVMSYGFLQIDNQTLSFVNREIRKVNKRLKSLPVNDAPDLGLQISDVNCQGNRHYAQYLETNLLDFFVIMPMPQTKQFLVRDASNIISACAVGCTVMDIELPPLIHSYESVEIDFEKGIYNYNRNFTQKYNEHYLHSFALIRAEDKIREGKDVEDTEQVSKSKNLDNWLYQPTDFSKSHFGAVISWKDVKLMGFQNFASTIFERFRHIMIDISDYADFETEEPVQAIVEEITRYSLFVKKQESNRTHIPKDNIQFQMQFLVTIQSNYLEINKRLVDRAISAARKVNAISKYTVYTIFIDLLACGQSDICSGHNKNGLDMACWHAEKISDLSEIYRYTDRSLSSNKNPLDSLLSIGRVEDKWVDDLRFELKSKKCAGENPFDSFDADIYLICKIIMRHEDIASYGGLKSSSIIIEDFTFCTYFGQTKEYLLVSFYVNVVDCVGGHSNMTLLVEYAILMEKLNRWAVSVDILLYINAGVEPSKCNEDASSSEEENCRCGWWIKQESNDSYLDKKSVTRQLYEKAKADEEEKPKTHIPKESSLLWLWILIPVNIFGALFTISAVFIVLHYRSKHILTKQEVDEFIKGRQTTRAEPVVEGDEAAETQPYNSEKYELSPSTFTIDITSSCLGSGEYGRVYRGSIRRDGDVIEAAVKIAKTNLVQKSHGYYLALKGLLSEIKILAYVGEHNHIVGLLGAYTKKVRKGEIAVFLELCQLGSLDKYLHSIKPQIIDDYVSPNNGALDPDASSLEEEESERGTIQVLDQETSKELFRWAGEIASGMEFLASKKLVHADLAARNVLLTSEKIAKISDFGLSRRLYDYTEYVKQSQGALPWRWMAPESLCRMFFTEKTDVWAFGVTLWEMFTLGDQPYPGLSWTPNFPALLERGLRLPEPQFNLNEIYSVMLRCWDITPSMRPSFSQLNTELNPV